MLEKATGPLPSDADGTWFVTFARMLFNSLPRSKVETVFQNLFVINFNYDRCLEHFFAHALNEAYGLTLSDASTLVEKLRIWRLTLHTGAKAMLQTDQGWSIAQLQTEGSYPSPKP